MKNIEIFVIGKYDYKSNIGTWIYYLNYRKAVIKRSGTITNAGSPNRTTLVSLYLALQQVKEPCNILVHSKAALGFKKPKQSSNKDLIIKIQTLINKAGHLVTFDTTDDFGRVSIWEQVYGTKSDGTKTKLNDKLIEKTTRPDIVGRNNPNDVFSTKKEEMENQSDFDKNIEEQALQSKDWREMYSDLMSESHGAWVPGSGGY